MDGLALLLPSLLNLLHDQAGDLIRMPDAFQKQGRLRCIYGNDAKSANLELVRQESALNADRSDVGQIDGRHRGCLKATLAKKPTSREPIIERHNPISPANQLKTPDSSDQDIGRVALQIGPIVRLRPDQPYAPDEERRQQAADDE